MTPEKQNKYKEILDTIETFFYSEINTQYNREMSECFFNIEKLYEPNENIICTLKCFMNKNKYDLITVIKKATQNIKENTNLYDLYFENRMSYFCSQLEIIIIFERLENRRFALEDYWISMYPIEDLEEIANAWGMSLD